MTRKEQTQYIYSCWNAKKAKGWRSHTKLNIPTTEALVFRLKQGYTVEALCKAINNYAMVLLGKDYTWDCVWTLREFLVRKTPDRSEYQLCRWLEGEFDEEKYRTPESRRRRIEGRQRMKEKQNKPIFIPVSAERRAEIKRKEILRRKSEVKK